MTSTQTNDDVYRVYLWPDGTWCEGPDLDEYLNFKSDDFQVLILTEYEYDDWLRDNA